MNGFNSKLDLSYVYYEMSDDVLQLKSLIPNSENFKETATLRQIDQNHCSAIGPNYQIDFGSMFNSSLNHKFILDHTNSIPTLIELTCKSAL
jgi:hypothetical protein